MTFPLTLRGHCKVINCPNFNIVLFPGVGKPKERERDEKIPGWWRNQNTYIY